MRTSRAVNSAETCRLAQRHMAEAGLVSNLLHCRCLVVFGRFAVYRSQGPKRSATLQLGLQFSSMRKGRTIFRKVPSDGGRDTTWS